MEATRKTKDLDEIMTADFKWAEQCKVADQKARSAFAP